MSVKSGDGVDTVVVCQSNNHHSWELLLGAKIAALCVFKLSGGLMHAVVSRAMVAIMAVRPLLLTQRSQVSRGGFNMGLLAQKDDTTLCNSFKSSLENHCGGICCVCNLCKPPPVGNLSRRITDIDVPHSHPKAICRIICRA